MDGEQSASCPKLFRHADLKVEQLALDNQVHQPVNTCFKATVRLSQASSRTQYRKEKKRREKTTIFLFFFYCVPDEAFDGWRVDLLRRSFVQRNPTEVDSVSPTRHTTVQDTRVWRLLSHSTPIQSHTHTHAHTHTKLQSLPYAVFAFRHSGVPRKAATRPTITPH